MKTILDQTTLPSPLKSGSRLRPKGFQNKKSTVTHLALTSLVDALTIIVLYLIVCTSSTEPMDLEDGIKLPTASVLQELDSSPVITFKNDNFYFSNQAIPEGHLKDYLEGLAKNNSLLKSGDTAIVVQADENIGFDKLQPLLVASAYAGIKQVKFAVLQKD